MIRLRARISCALISLSILDWLIGPPKGKTRKDWRKSRFKARKSTRSKVDSPYLSWVCLLLAKRALGCVLGRSGRLARRLYYVKGHMARKLTRITLVITMRATIFSQHSPLTFQTSNQEPVRSFSLTVWSWRGRSVLILLPTVLPS